MKSGNQFVTACAVSVCVFCLATFSGKQSVVAQSFAVVRSFGILEKAHGLEPYSHLVQGPDGAFYGTTSQGEGSVAGTIFKIQPDGTGFTVVKWFTNYWEGRWPQSGLVVSGSTLYGTATSSGGPMATGAVFRMDTDGGNFSVLKAFDYYEGRSPSGGLALAGNTLYGTTENGGPSNDGTVFKVNIDGTGFAVLKNFNSSDGHFPTGHLTVSGSTIFGTTWGGGSAGKGTVFKMDTSGSGFQVLWHFGSSAGDGENPRSGLTLVGNTLYGTTERGGTFSGTLFKIEADGTGYTVLKKFTGSDGSSPYGALNFVNGTFYGTTHSGGTFGYGTVFKVNTNGAGYSVLKHFTMSDGASPRAAVVLAGSTLLGTTSAGGSSGAGTIFKVGTNATGFQVLKAFACSDGQNPRAGLTFSEGALYGTTYRGGNLNYGTLFKVDLDGNGYTILRHFNGTTGGFPASGLTMFGGMLYGTVESGGNPGYGAVFRVGTNGTGYSVLKYFSWTGGDGAFPAGGLALSGNTFYGVTQRGGTADYGTLYKINWNASGYAVLKTFNGNDGGGTYPAAGLTLIDDTLYGTTSYGGTADYGTIYRIRTNGIGFAVLKSLSLSDGTNPKGELLAVDGALYGTTSSGGNSGAGTVFKLNMDGTGFTVLRHFTGRTGNGPADSRSGLVFRDGTLYGTSYSGGTSDFGTVFSLRTNGTAYTVINSLSGPNGLYSPASLVLAGDALYGVADSGGQIGSGVIFGLALPVRPAALSAQLVPGGHLRLSTAASPGSRYALEWAHSFPPSATWQTLATNSAGSDGWVLFTNAPSGNLPDFYRTRHVPFW